MIVVMYNLNICMLLFGTSLKKYIYIFINLYINHIVLIENFFINFIFIIEKKKIKKKKISTNDIYIYKRQNKKKNYINTDH